MTSSTATGMTSRDWAFLTCRVLALYFLYGAISTLSWIGFSFFAPSAGDSAWHLGYFYLLLLLLQSAAGLVLWFGAPRLAGKMAPGQADETGEAAPGEQSVTQLLSLAVFVLGLILLFFAIPRAAGLVAKYVLEDGFQDRDLIEITMVATRLVLGITLVFGSRGIANIIKSARRWQVS